MRISLYLGTSIEAERSAQREYLRHAHTQVAAAVETGYTRVWVAEHHAASRYFPPPLQLLSWIAGAHPGIGVGTNILIPSLYHPLHLAEAVATLHLLSGERLAVGVGAGFRPAELNAFRVTPEDKYAKLRAAVSDLRTLLSGGELPAPVGGSRMSIQVKLERQPPILWAAMSSVGVRSARRYAQGILANPLYGFDRQFALAEEFAAGNPVPDAQRPIIADVVVGPTHEAAMTEAERVLGAEYASFKHWRAKSPLLDGVASDADRFAAAIHTVALVGTPDEVAARLAGFTERGATEVILRFEHLGADPERVTRSIRQVGEAVGDRVRVP